MRESSELTPATAYGRSKRLAEIIHQRWRGANGARRLATVRPAVVFGPGERGNFSYLVH